MFNNECVGHLAYESTAAAIALAAGFITFLFDFFGSRLSHNATPSHIRLHGEKGSRDSPVAEEDSGHNHGFEAAFMAEQNWQVLLLEAGIIFHSLVPSHPQILPLTRAAS
jgi:zinc transporter 1/2/3